jgi:hypothetical protein
MLESGEAKSLKEVTAREGIDNSYVSRMINLTTLAPDIVAAILDDALPNYITLFDLAVDLTCPHPSVPPVKAKPGLQDELLSSMLLAGCGATSRRGCRRLDSGPLTSPQPALTSRKPA